jgi:hypothetical protein
MAETKRERVKGFVIPAKAGIQLQPPWWIPAFAE